MCGIAGIISLNNEPIKKYTLISMIDSIRHRLMAKVIGHMIILVLAIVVYRLLTYLKMLTSL